MLNFNPLLWIIHALMTRTWRISFLVLVLFSMNACRSNSGTDPGWTSEALQMPSSYDKPPVSGTPGARLVASYCSQCHGTPSPKAHSASDWDPVFRRMILLMEKSNRRQGMGGMMRGMGRNRPMGMMGARVPTEKEQAEMLSYLRQNALKSIPVDSVQAEGNLAAGEFVRYCSRCHALPDPGQHTAAEWPAVVDRMQAHARDGQLPVMTPEEKTQVLTYLRQHARQ